MNQRIAHVAIVVDDYDEAIFFYTSILEFDLIEDTILDENKRWVIVAPKGASECSILIAKASNEKQHNAIGNQAGGRVSMFLFTDDFWRDYTNYMEKGVTFVRPPHEFEYGTVAVFEDYYGNLWDLIQPTEKNKGILKTNR